MILVTKPIKPGKLSDGLALTLTYCNAFEGNSQAYVNGETKFTFNSAVYGHAAVKDELRRAQYNKCCYCEGIFEAYAAADVEHYRPKGYSQQEQGSRQIYPGYYWLAYDWDNLFYSCQVCNRSCKKNFFPLEDPDMRVCNHLGDLDTEEPLILKPSGPEDPRHHIHFRDTIAFGKTVAGETTVDIVRLNRVSLVEERLEHRQMLKVCYDIVQLFGEQNGIETGNLVEDALGFLKKAILPESRFSAMASHLISDWRSTHKIAPRAAKLPTFDQT